ncbi:hypothetical protein J2X72_003392 [Phyllobacterium sp. 1468]|uniref:hypothetical protein n=1 Tax=Phyllobacterium sp. 1468 TaxID=2817759 RepID=UPI002859E116|nr:hypothetical protein [Phyllobacterium sp. 1468]MDR6634582.1 hypothetical protein [Phyllobacterium sp. 1468]
MDNDKAIPENLSLLHAGEEDLRQKSVEIIEASNAMYMHVSMIQTCMDMLQYVRKNTPDMSEDQLIVALLSASVFNSIASGLKLMFGGYYQASGLQIRYVLETGWLIDYLKTDPALVQIWKVTPEDKRQNVFRPGLVRDKLDKRDGFKEKKREAHYKRLCVLCGHPSFAGFTMLRSESNGDAHMGPFLVPSLLEACVQELVQCSVVAGFSIMRFFPPNSLSDYKARVHYIETYAGWTEEVFGEKPDPTSVDEAKKIIAILENGL